ncbi:type I polyketide synthase [Amycolatopsis aidingensis]|uniref:type I polyketide synthase n=1 Tax=Amycolatopsis aidingensis TaxID=2842453 RepID=UPI001C0ACF10|nr:type I polyketide synthase [Amycolatopsis aidingensis]
MTDTTETTRPDEAQDLDQVAIIGMSGRFPGAGDIGAFWENLRQGREGISEHTTEELSESGVRPDLLERKDYVRAKGVLTDADLFDASFFGYSPREAEIIDPQHRVFLECAWEALESAGCDPRTFTGRIGVFAGATLNTYMIYNVMANRRAFEATGAYQTLLAGDKDFLATRVAYKLDLQGPAMTVQTACSTSLTAVHLACQSLLNGECDIALAGGVSVTVPLRDGYVYEQGGILSADGHCRPFDAAAGGTVASNGAGVVVLRRLADARDGGDVVDAVIRGSAINNDGALKAGYTAPSVTGQAGVISEALAVSDVDAAGIGYVETHGTGTALGDPIEVAALTRAFREHTAETGYCAIGSVKSNIGHLDAAAGVTALIKAALVLKHGEIPPSLHYTTPNPQLELDTSPFYVCAELRPWPRTGGGPRRAGVSSFGIGGTNAHAVLEEAPAPREPDGEPDRAAEQVLLLSARTPAALAANARRLADHLEAGPDTDLGDTAFTLARRRSALELRAAVVAGDRAEAVAGLRGLTEAAAVTAAEGEAPVAFLFPGQGAQYVDMARGLYGSEPEFTAELDRCAELFTEHLGQDLRPLLFAEPGTTEEAATRLEQTAITQPALFAVEYALARMWAAWGVRPRAMAGHSIGEFVAACLAGVFFLPDAVRLVAARGRLVQAMPPGAMLTVFLPESEVTGWLDGELSLAAVNSTGLSVVSGPAEAVDGLAGRLAEAGIACRRLHTSHAFHSPSMDGAVRPFVDEVRGVRLNPPEIPFCSNVTGTWITAEQATDPGYWGEHLRRPVRFADAAAELLTDPELVLLEVGPGHTLGNFVRGHRQCGADRTVAGSLRHPKEQVTDSAYLLRGLGALWSAGVPVDWAARYPADRHRVLRLPGYAFQRQRYWVDPDEDATGPGPRRGTGATESTEATETTEVCYTPGWKRLPRGGGRPEDVSGTRWIVLGTELGLGSRLAQRLEDAGATVVRVAAGEEFAKDGERAWRLDPARREHYAELLSTVDSEEVGAVSEVRVLHLWSLGGAAAERLTGEELQQARRGGFDSVLALAQGAGDAGTGLDLWIDVLSRGVHEVTGVERLRPEHALLSGICTVLPQEVAGLECRLLDLDADPHSPDEATLTAVHTMLRTTEPAQRSLALRGRQWWTREFDPAPLPAAEAGGRLRDGGIYLITGGLGGVGLALAEQIAAEARNPVLALLGRSEFPEPDSWDDWPAEDGGELGSRVRRIRELRALGAKVLVLRADVTDRGQLAAALRGLRDTHGCPDGVVHAAGAPSQGLIATKTAEEADRVLAAKTYGTLLLDELCPAEDLDFLLLCSSVTAVLGGPGQSDYAAANAFLDAFAQHKRRDTGADVVSVGWDTWQETGMAAGLASRLGGESEGEATGHPLLRLVRTEPDSRTYAATFSTADSWIVDDHRIMGHGLVPGTAYLELIRAAVAEQAGDREIELRDVLFLQPVVVPDGQRATVYLTLTERADRIEFTVRSRAGESGWQDHTTGSVYVRDRGADTVRDLDQVLRDCAATEVLDTTEAIRARLPLERSGEDGTLDFSFGPRWRALERIQAGPHRLLATLRLDEAFHADLADYTLHPALLDLAGGAARLHLRQDVYYLPFTYRSLTIAHPLTSTVHCAITLAEPGEAGGETVTCDIELLDPRGRLLVRITEFTIKRVHDVDGLLAQVQRGAALAEAGAGEAAGTGVLAELSAGMSPRQGRAAFTRVLSAPELPEHVVVSAREFTAMRRLAASITPELLEREVAGLAPPGGTHPRPELDTPYVAPETEEELAVAAIWQEVLGIDQVGLHDDFFALGGHSLAAVQIGTKVKARFGMELDLPRFFDTPTVANTVTLLAAGTAAAEDTIQALRRDEPGAQDDDELAGLSDEEVEASLRELLAAEGEQDDEQRDDEQRDAE